MWLIQIKTGRPLCANGGVDGLAISADDRGRDGRERVPTMLTYVRDQAELE
ncbi:hypothetical protein [Zhongshania arctica]|uniref:Uncharacterized protein n=1 Tax=Zhongshania arctica TaxID=3238302 RepID=A0ABV3TYL1_9GAMM